MAKTIVTSKETEKTEADEEKVTMVAAGADAMKTQTTATGEKAWTTVNGKEEMTVHSLLSVSIS